MSDENDPTDANDATGDASARLSSVALPFATAIASLALGALLGGVVGWMAKPSEQLQVQVPRDLNAHELEAACAPAIAETANELEAANARVAVLTRDVATKEARVVELESEMARRADRGRALVVELEAAKKELAEVKAQLAQAEEDKKRLVDELNHTVEKLKQTERELEQQVALTERAKEDALTNKWYRFLNDAQLTICEKGNRKKLGRCRDSVLAALKAPEVQDRFAHCVRSLQATPSVHEITRADDSLPEYARYLNEDDRVVKGWYLLLCDPTLPESDGFLNEEHLPSATARVTN